MSTPQSIEHAAESLKTRRALSPGVYRAAALALVVAHFAMLMLFFKPAIGTPDASGYFVQARLMATKGRTWFDRESPIQYVNEHWLSPGNDRYFSQYPPGLSGMAAVLFRAAGPTAALLLNPVLASLTLLGLFMVCRLWVGEGWGLMAAAIMAVNPAANERALSCDSHTAVAFFLVWGIYLLARWSLTLSPFLAFAAGLVLGLIPTVRYPEVIFLFAAGVFMLLHLDRGSRVWGSVAAASVGALVPISCLLLRNQFAFGAFWRTGYTLTQEQTAFDLGSFVRHILPYAGHILGEGTGLLAIAGLAGMIAMCRAPATRRQGVLLLALVVPITLLYMAYSWPPASIRFLLPTLCVYWIGAVWAFKLMAERRPSGATRAAVAVVVLTACWGLPVSLWIMGRLKQDNSPLADVTQIATRYAGPGSILIASPRIQQQLDYVGSWRLVDETILTGKDDDPRRQPPPDGRREGRPPRDDKRGTLVVHDRERQAIMERYKDREGPALSGRMLEDLDAWRPKDGKVYWVGDFKVIQGLVPESDQVRVLARFRVASHPPPPPQPPPRFGFHPPPPPQDRFDRRGSHHPPRDQELVLAEWIRL